MKVETMGKECVVEGMANSSKTEKYCFDSTCDDEDEEALECKECHA